MSRTPALALPLLAAEQAQKHVTVNEALRALDALVQLAVLDRDLAAPPGAPAEGDRYIVAAAATGAWTGHESEVAAWDGGAWAFHAPAEGWLAWAADENVLLVFNGAAWVSDTAAAITELQNLTLLGIGTAADAANPFAAKLNKALWTAKTAAEGGDGDLRYTLNKETAADTLSLLLQRGFSGRAEVGLIGDDDLAVKVSADGASWVEALRVDRSTGRLSTRGQIGFPAVMNASADPNTLDDYEEGSWTPTATFSTPGTFVPTYAVQSGTYVKVGAIAYVCGILRFHSNAYSDAAGVFRLGGLPFAATGTGPMSLARVAKIGFSDLLLAEVSNTLSYAVLWSVIAGGGKTAIGPTQVPPSTNDIEVTFGGIYRA